MRLFACHWLAISSLLLGLVARAETRPEYGGTLRVMMHAAPTSLDPVDARLPDSFAGRSITFLLFDTLVTMSDGGRAEPGLAESWQAAKGNQRWQFRLRHGVKLHDGTLLTSETVAASLRAGNPTWNVRPDGDSVVIDCAEPNSEMLAELAEARNAIAKRDGPDRLISTGPFLIVEWQPGKKLTLSADEDCWRGRPYFDRIEIEMGRNFRDQAAALEGGRAEVIEVPTEQVHHFSPSKSRLVSSAPVELIALVFSRDISSTEDKLMREALGLSVDRESIHTVLLQGAGQPTGSLLPTWISGYGFVFPSKADLQKARQLRSQVQTSRIWTIGYDPNDSLARLVVDRIALNARDAGLSVVPTTVGASDLHLMRIPLASSNPWIALQGIVIQSGATGIKTNGSLEELFGGEQAALGTYRIIPLFHLPVSYAGSTSLKDWAIRADGSLDLASAWLGAGK
jgi:peptide/nickel transport system substrate-binding protein